jgi:hypothetical protein
VGGERRYDHRRNGCGVEGGGGVLINRELSADSRDSPHSARKMVGPALPIY